MKIRVGDKVKVIAGKDKGAEGVVKATDPKKNKVLLDGINMMTKSRKSVQGREGGITQDARPIDASNVMLVDEKSGKVSRIGYKIVDGKKYRFIKKSDSIIETKK